MRSHVGRLRVWSSNDSVHPTHADDVWRHPCVFAVNRESRPLENTNGAQLGDTLFRFDILDTVAFGDDNDAAFGNRKPACLV